jgi:hypothetical protein
LVKDAAQGLEVSLPGQPQFVDMGDVFAQGVSK